MEVCIEALNGVACGKGTGFLVVAEVLVRADEWTEIVEGA